MNWSVLLQTILAYVMVFIVVAVLLVMAPIIDDSATKYASNIIADTQVEEDEG